MAEVTSPTKQPSNIQQQVSGEFTRPIDYHAQPHTIPPTQKSINTGDFIPRPDVLQRNSAVPPPPRLTGNFSVDFAMQGSSGAAFEAMSSELAMELSFQAFGLFDGFKGSVSAGIDAAQTTTNQDAFYESGYKDGQNLRDMWENRPDFKIPTIKVPKFHRPELPRFEIPKIPEFDIPKIPKPEIPKIPKFEIPKIPEFNPFPKPTIPEPEQKPQPESKEKDIPRLKDPAPTPVPSDLERQLRDLDLSPCGTISFGISYVTKITGERWVSNSDNTGGYFELLTVPSSLNEVFGLYQAWLAEYYSDQSSSYSSEDIVSWVESGGGTGSNTDVSLGGGINYRNYQGIGNGVGADGDPYRSGYPKYYASQSIVSPTGSTTKAALNSILDSLSSRGRTPEIYRISFSNPGAKDCPIGKPAPPPPPPPKPPEDCDCAMTCCPDIDYRKIRAIVEEELKKIDVTAAIPLSWQIRHEGENPQMVIQFAEMKNAASGNTPAKYDSAKYPITVPHWKGGKSDKPSLPPYKKGNWEGILVLKDNSKVTINAQSEAECTKIINAIKPWIKSDMLKDSYFKCGKITTKEPIKQIQVYPKYGRYFGKGQKNNKPDWRVDLP